MEDSKCLHMLQSITLHYISKTSREMEVWVSLRSQTFCPTGRENYYTKLREGESFLGSRCRDTVPELPSLDETARTSEWSRAPSHHHTRLGAIRATWRLKRKAVLFVVIMKKIKLKIVRVVMKMIASFHLTILKHSTWIQWGVFWTCQQWHQCVNITSKCCVWRCASSNPTTWEDIPSRGGWLEVSCALRNCQYGNDRFAW